MSTCTRKLAVFSLACFLKLSPGRRLGDHLCSSMKETECWQACWQAGARSRRASCVRPWMDRSKLTQMPELPRCSDRCPPLPRACCGHMTRRAGWVPTYGILDPASKTIGNNTSDLERPLAVIRPSTSFLLMLCRDTERTKSKDFGVGQSLVRLPALSFPV